MHVICIFMMQQRQQQRSFSQASRNAVQFKLFLNMPLSSCKFKYNKINKLIM